MKRFLASLLLLLVSISPAQADFNDGVVAYLMGKYDRAFAIMRPLAGSADHGYAQYYIGMMYFQGQGVEHNYEEAGKWFRKASKHNIPNAQYKLANLYMKGFGVPRDYEYAYAWYRTGAAHHHKLSINALNAARQNLSVEELKQAENLAVEFISKFGPKDGVQKGNTSNW